jgi:uncharacterized repeat protein (TIGR01451 family)
MDGSWTGIVGVVAGDGSAGHLVGGEHHWSNGVPRTREMKMEAMSRTSTIRRRAATAFIAGVISLLVSPAVEYVSAANPSGDLRIEIIAAYNLVVDSNIGSSSSVSPRSAYLGATFHNDGTTDLHNVFAYIGNYIDGTNDTPGLYPTRVNPTPLTGTLSLTHLGGSAGTADAIRYFGPIPAGESVTAYWLVSYPLTDQNGTPTWGTSIKPDDDLWLQYDVWATAIDATNGNLTATVTRNVTMRNEISASANKIFPNGANKVPQEYLDLLGIYAPSWTNSVDDGSVGTSIKVEGYWYDMGNVGDGFDNNGDSLPDHNIWMQPVGDPSYFDASCLRLVKTHSMVIIKLLNGDNEVRIADDQLYFDQIPDNNGVVGLVIYDFLPLRTDCTSQLTPYQEAASGRDNEKFNSDFGAVLGGPLTPKPSEVNLLKTANPAMVYPGSNIAYTIAFTNSGSIPVGDADRGVPLVVSDRIPTGMVFVAASATNNNVLPAGITSYTTLFSTNYGGAWTGTEPPAAKVTDIQWWLTGALAPGATGVVRFAVTVPASYSNGLPLIVNTAGLSFGSTTPFTNSTAMTFVMGTNRIGDAVFKDGGSGVFFGNGSQDPGEPGIPNIAVTLYYDLNSNGVQDASDVFLAATNSDSNGSYLFASLLDGSYIAVVDANDPDMPFGYTTTTSTYHSVDLDSGGTTIAMVAYTNADFGFAPTLGLTKSGTNAVREGSMITYTITVTNRMPGNTGKETFTIWGTTNYPASHLGSGWDSTETNAYKPSYPDNIYAAWTSSGNDDRFGVSGYSLAPHIGNITKVELLIRMDITNGWINDTATFRYLTNGAAVFETNIALSSLPLGTNTIVYDVSTSVTAWAWSMFGSGVTNVIDALGHKVGGPDGSRFWIDQMGFRITTDQSASISSNLTSTLNPVPLTDTYDADLLQYMYAIPLPSSVTTNGTAPNKVGTLYWANIGPVYASAAQNIAVTYRVLEPPNNATSTVTNVVMVTNALYATGRSANTETATVATVVSPGGSIGDYIWRDEDGDGVQDPGEVGIEDVAVVLTPPPGVDIGAGAGKPVTNRTTLSGYYMFTGLPADGSYTVRIDTATLPTGGGTITNTWDRDGTNDSITIVNIDFDSQTGGDTVTNADFGYKFQFVTIRGQIWADWDRSGTTTPDSGEEGLTNVTVYLFTNSVPGVLSTAVATNRTDTNGFFRFVGNYTTNYCVLVVTNSGSMTNLSWTQTYDTDGLSSSNYVSGVGVAGDVFRVDFSYVKKGTYSIGDQVYYDWNGNRVWDANEEGLTNITIRLYQDENTNGVINPGIDAFIAVTQVGGTYLFTNMPAGTYILFVDQNDPDFPLNVVCTADPYGPGDGFSVVTVTNANRLDQDFGYQPYGSASIGDTVWRDMNGDGVQQNGGGETGISNVLVTLLVDINLDGVYLPLLSTNTTSTGCYVFQNLPAGPYRVQVSTNDTDLPKDSFGVIYRVPSDVVTLTLTNNESRMNVDFGFAPMAAVGDTVYWDANTNGTQDSSENGVTGATVSIYIDVNTNGIYDAADVFPAVSVTNTDSSGRYIFSNLSTGWYVVVVSTNGQLAGKVITGDPDADGNPSGPGRDGQYGVTLSYGTILMGVDFGFVPTGIIGDRLWIDSNNNKTQDVGEVGIPYVTVELWTNGGVTAVATNVTDSDGYYVFSGVQDGTYRVIVQTNDPDFASQLTPTYNADVYAGGVLDNCATNVQVYLGTITNINSVAWTNGDLAIDFGYRFAGDKGLIGTVGLETGPFDGVLGTGTNGVGPGEYPYSNVILQLDLWMDKNGDGLRGVGEVFTIGTTTSATNGDYAFGNLPASSGASNFYVVSMIAPADELGLTTTSTASSVVSNFLDNSGYTASALQIVPVPESALATNIDFAFKSMVAFDYGDLPDSYITTMPNAPRHKVKPSPTLYLGATVDTEPDGTPTVDASGDGADEDGVFPVGVWQSGTTGGKVRVTVAGSGWLVAFIDFGTNGTFVDVGDLVITQAVSTGVATNTFTIPTGGIVSTNVTTLYARFRLFDSLPSFPALAYFGSADAGEVEDYYWRFGSVGNRVWNDLNSNGVQEAGEAGMKDVRVFVDANTNGVYDAGEVFSTTDTNGIYNIGGFCTGSYTIAVDTNTLVAGSTPVYDYDGTSTAHRAVATMTNGQVRTDIVFGYVLPVTDLGVLKDVNRSYVATNEYVWFTISLTNNGPQAATGIRLQDTWPATISYISYWASTGMYNSGAGIWSNFSLAVGAGATLVITGRVNTTQKYQFITNRVQITYLDQYDTNPANDQDDAVIQTLVVLSRVEAFASGSDSWVEWETSSEIGTAGFNLYRVNGDGARVKVNGDLVPAAVDAPQGGVYRLRDPDIWAGVAYAYVVEELEQDGKTRQYGPFDVVATATPATAPVGAEGVARENQVVRVPEKVEEGMAVGFAAAAPMFAKSIMAFDSFVPPALQPLKLTVKAAGVYGVAASDVAALFGADPSFVAIAFATGSVRLSNRGRTIPFLSSKDGSVLYFHGEAIDSPYTDANVYWLTWEAGVTMATVDGTAGTGGGVTTFRDTIHFEVDRYGATAVVLEPEGDYWLWDYFMAGSATAGQRSFVLRADGAVPSSEQASLTVRLVSSTAAGRGRDHHVVVRLNGAVIGEDAWAGIVTRNLKFTFDQSLLVAGDNTVEITSVLDPLVPYSIMYLDSFDLSYRRAHEAVGDRLTFRAGAAGAIAVGGFTVPEVRILDITDPAAPKSVSGVVAGPANGSNRAVFMAPDTTTVYTAFTPGSALPVAAMAAVVAGTDLRSGANEGRHVIVTVPALAAAAERLAEHRRSRGLSSKVVMLGEIYDQFGDGIATPYAIRAFLAHAATAWREPPRYVVLAGEGSYDYKGIKKTGDCIVPPFMMATALSLFATDAPYSDPDGDGTADLAVGRLPVATAAELDAVVDKIVGYERAPAEEWQTLATLSADVPDKGGDFTGSSDATAALVPPGWSQTKVHMAEMSVTDARLRLIGRINQGTAFLNFFGHGGMDTLSGRGVLKTADVGGLANGNRLPIVTAMSCVIGRFEIPGYDCLGEALVLKAGGGAVAVWAPSGLTYNEPSAALGRAFYRVVLQQGEGVLGEAILRAKTEAAAEGCPTESLALYNLLGDPATVVAGFDAAFGGGQAAGMSFGEWRRLAFGWTDRQDESLCGDLADPDGDGIVNLAEYAFGRNPRHAETGSVFKLAGEAQAPEYDFEVCFTRNRQAPDIGVEVEISSDLITWYGGQTYVVATRVTDDGNGQTETVHAMMRTPDPEKAKAFVRLRAWKR